MVSTFGASSLETDTVVNSVDSSAPSSPALSSVGE